MVRVPGGCGSSAASTGTAREIVTTATKHQPSSRFNAPTIRSGPLLLRFIASAAPAFATRATTRTAVHELADQAFQDDGRFGEGDRVPRCEDLVVAAELQGEISVA